MVPKPHWLRQIATHTLGSNPAVLVVPIRKRMHMLLRASSFEPGRDVSTCDRCRSSGSTASIHHIPTVKIMDVVEEHEKQACVRAAICLSEASAASSQARL